MGFWGRAAFDETQSFAYPGNSGLILSFSVRHSYQQALQVGSALSEEFHTSIPALFLQPGSLERGCLCLPPAHLVVVLLAVLHG